MIINEIRGFTIDNELKKIKKRKYSKMSEFQITKEDIIDYNMETLKNEPGYIYSKGELKTINEQIKSGNKNYKDYFDRLKRNDIVKNLLNQDLNMGYDHIIDIIDKLKTNIASSIKDKDEYDYYLILKEIYDNYYKPIKKNIRNKTGKIIGIYYEFENNKLSEKDIDTIYDKLLLSLIHI